MIIGTIFLLEVNIITIFKLEAFHERFNDLLYRKLSFKSSLKSSTTEIHYIEIKHKNQNILKAVQVEAKQLQQAFVTVWLRTNNYSILRYELGTFQPQFSSMEVGED